MRGYTLLNTLLASVAVQALDITSKPGQKGVIPHWDLQPSTAVENIIAASKPGYDVSTWHHAPTSRCTLMGCLLAAGKLKDSDLWYSDNLNKFNWGQFSVPWLYRNEFSLTPSKGQHYFLETHGIASKADLYLNGKQIADEKHQAGSFGGHIYDITGFVAKKNAFVANVYPSDFTQDLVQGFVDWNPEAPDNSTGIWRDVVVKQTGQVVLGPMSVSVDLDTPVERNPAIITVRAKVQNLEDHEVKVVAHSVVSSASSHQESAKSQIIALGAYASKLVEIVHKVDKPEIWWPKAWGKQNLYKSQLGLSVNSQLSDKAQTQFGIRTVASHVNNHNDTVFAVNGHPFQVLGGGYSPDHFFRWNRDRFVAIVQYALDMGLNTIRLEGTLEHPELYEVADEMGVMIIAGWVCCSKWESWEYNHDLATDPPPLWTKNDYQTANASMRHEAAMLQPHPSMLAFLVGSDFWPNDRATEIYVKALKDAFWQVPVLASASKRGYPKLLGPSGMKMDGPYDWVPPNYWYDTEPSEDRLGAAFGFGSELGAGVGTPEKGSLRRFLSKSDMEDLWKRPNKNLFHMSTNASSFYNRKIYNEALFKRYGVPTSLDEYLLKAQMMDYEATRAQFEAYSSQWNAARPATGSIYWMLNNAWPSLHWNQFDHYLHPAGSYFGSKVGLRTEHVSYDYVRKAVWVINHSLDQKGPREIAIELIDLKGNLLDSRTFSVRTKPNTARKADKLPRIAQIKDVALLRLTLTDAKNTVLSRNVYWLGASVDRLDWDNSTWYHTPVTKFSDFSALTKMHKAKVTLNPAVEHVSNDGARVLELENTSSVPAFFVRLNLVDERGKDVNPVIWSDNYVTLWPKEKMLLRVSFPGKKMGRVEMSGGNIEAIEAPLLAKFT
ncbi:Exo-beta-D-glucosaminidase [Neonectria ditissima]|uniref:Exo-beta-D-glucosaminidase n=1 Tax=Neonectria ditissima TaxID=78410 RepID=A0A0N8H701_9HYPO|nr:Exo-beta-D-glucosaminidase [Neonectria ditissima]